ncbi:UPF0716 family protein affecting phage T7 exclusion [Bacillus thermophilus]|uniref:UPF0716 family protein affecting phage T7 exclusion n=1 Tax=Siminovitchia thermophila TaxID=1245522 RepID=A0ABS2R720_9BACI|nr:UPF0716 family protein affecting phage T7 exclusion [Siminovitchia thermophila]ONK24911.1 hypothetical protein BLX87_02715 [Bacillus sp. VT-16-64]
MSRFMIVRIILLVVAEAFTHIFSEFGFLKKVLALLIAIMSIGYLALRHQNEKQDVLLPISVLAKRKARSWDMLLPGFPI